MICSRRSIQHAKESFQHATADDTDASMMLTVPFSKHSEDGSVHSATLQAEVDKRV